jgi:hypothetical protein
MSKRNSVRMNGSAVAAAPAEVPSYLLTGKVAVVTGSGKTYNFPYLNAATRRPAINVAADSPSRTAR